MPCNMPLNPLAPRVNMNGWSCSAASVSHTVASSSRKVCWRSRRSGGGSVVGLPADDLDPPASSVTVTERTPRPDERVRRFGRVTTPPGERRHLLTNIVSNVPKRHLGLPRHATAGQVTGSDPGAAPRREGPGTKAGGERPRSTAAAGVPTVRVPAPTSGATATAGSERPGRDDSDVAGHAATLTSCGNAQGGLRVCVLTCSGRRIGGRTSLGRTSCGARLSTSR